MERASLLRLLLACSLRSPASAAGVRQSAPEALECECDKVRCTCTKQCDCLVAREGYASFLQTMEVPVEWDGTSDAEGATILRSEEGSSSAAFLQATESSENALMPAAGNEELLHCDCQKVRCNCLKRCECAIGTSARGVYASAASAIQITESAGPLPDHEEAVAAAPRRISRHRGGGAAAAA